VKQLSDIVIGLERNGQSDDPVEANTTKIRVLKDRDFGSKGLAAAVAYDKETTRLVEKSLEDFDDE
jgi:twinkle protein